MIQGVDNSTPRAIGTRDEGSGSLTRVEDNFWCDIANEGIDNPHGMIINNNQGLGSAEPNCANRIAQIEAEMNGNPNPPPGDTLINGDTFDSHSGDVQSNSSVDNAWDGCTDLNPGCTVITNSANQHTTTYDLGACHTLADIHILR